MPVARDTAEVSVAVCPKSLEAQVENTASVVLFSDPSSAAGADPHPATAVISKYPANFNGFILSFRAWNAQIGRAARSAHRNGRASSSAKRMAGEFFKLATTAISVCWDW